MDELKRLRKILGTSHAVIFYWKALEDWPVEFVSDSIEQFGYQADDFLSGRITYSQIIHPDDLSQVSSEVELFTANHIDEFCQIYRILDSKGKTCWIDDRTVIERDASGQPQHYLGTIVDITEQKKNEAWSDLLSRVINESTDEFYIFDAESLKFDYLNQAALLNLGYSSGEIANLTPLDIKPNLSKELFLQRLTELKEQPCVILKTEHQRKDGSLYPVEVKIQSIDVLGETKYAAVVRDMSELYALQEEQQKKFEFVQNVIDGIAESVMVINQDYTVELMNEAARKSSTDSVIANIRQPKCYEVSHNRSTPCDGLEHPCPLKAVLQSKEQASVIHNHGSQENPEYVELMAKPLIDAKGEVYAIVESAHDITSLIQTQNALIHKTTQLNYQATHDELTGLVNRQVFQDRLEHALQQAKRQQKLVVVVFVDLDKFKQINDGLGHQAGDEVLTEVASRLQGLLRSCDTVARMGGDEFTLVLEDLHDLQSAERVLQKVQEVFAEPISTSCGDVLITLSLGAAVYPNDAITPSELVRLADLALYDVKFKGRNGHRFYHQLKALTYL
ncbi:hypothetical protein THMIRHAM_01320 [Thiomicrorhabdus immobilis]|uniref:Diguanylate cyclase n=1 Tax=Thiomicrorhabdus immobilis TaxID=2791037 RepID=A0ABM7MAJ7_9GAMM|nr:sensor domain-containing diguanylate cyclase [Thiomicrorhabdus immobilis]BCN92347.1 hypothetical protein THMIRHAM_01320 [Thiomicrorhabdus immobilis]